LNGKRIIPVVEDPCYVLIENEIHHFDDIDYLKIKPFLKKESVQVTKSQEKVYFEKFMINLISKFDVRAQGFTIDEKTIVPKPHLKLCFDINEKPLLELGFRYDEVLFLYQDKTRSVVHPKHTPSDFYFKKTCRDFSFEDRLYDLLFNAGLELTNNSLLQLRHNKSGGHTKLISWFNVNNSLIDRYDIQTHIIIDHKVYFTKGIDLSVSITESNDWFDVFGTATFGSFKIPFKRLRKNIVSGIREFRLENGEIAILPEEWFEEFQELMLIGTETGGHLRLKRFHFNAISKKMDGFASESILKLRQLNQAQIPILPAPTLVNATLRQYQVEGFSWMLHLQKCGFGGCLADDMGLGKTLQTLALLAHSIQPRPKVAPVTCFEDDDGTGGEVIKLDLTGKPMSDVVQFPVMPEEDCRPACLIVMPVSLIHNWEREIKRFTQHLRVMIYSGPNRSKSLDRFGHYDIVLTSYGIVRNDIEQLKDYNFNYVILDESQYIKNPSSKIYHAVNRLKAAHRLVLTGTPIENSLTDLWTQLNFLNRGLLGNLSFFREQFINSIEKNKDEDKQAKLKVLIHPFLLRRTKEEVAKDLPSLTEQTVFCEMSEDQKSFYESEKAKIRNYIYEIAENQLLEKSSVMILQGLTRLRQICNHPVLVDSEYSKESGKFETVISHIESLIAENHKVLIFSTFVKHLECYEAYFEQHRICHVKLTGSSQNRDQIVTKFQEDESVKVFLISLKAGGVGLNLTAADYVILLDPWWNPAAEAQAINRAHRIGQDKKVFVYRFIAKDSIEEKIILLQEQKSAIADLFVNTNNPFKAMSINTIEELLL
jgi:SNF2 family DNA or RNA helicase